MALDRGTAGGAPADTWQQDMMAQMVRRQRSADF
jgi:hypothetical protein